MRPDTPSGESSSSIFEKMEAKQKELDGLLIELSGTMPGSAKVSEIGAEICSIYRSNVQDRFEFRHQYHLFLETLKGIQKSDMIDALMTNLRTIIDANVGDAAVCQKLLKLHDHISMDIVRIAMQDESHSTVLKLDDVEKKIGDIESQSNELEGRITILHNKAESAQLELVAILGVFAAIVIGFTGGLDIIGGAMSNIGTEDFPLILFTVSLCGMVLFDVLLLLMGCVFRIVKGRHEEIMPLNAVITFNGLMIVLMLIGLLWKSL